MDRPGRRSSETQAREVPETVVVCEGLIGLPARSVCARWTEGLRGAGLSPFDFTFVLAEDVALPLTSTDPE